MATRKNLFDQFDAPAKANVFDAFDGQTEAASTARYAGDSALALGQGGVQGTQMLTNVAGADNQASRTLGSTAQKLASMESPFRRAEKQNRARLIDEAEKSGSLLKEIGANLGGFAEAPLDTTLNALGTSIPTLGVAAMTGGGSVAAQLGARVLPGLIGGAQGVGAVKGAIYDTVKNKLTGQGMTEAAADARASEAQAYGGENAAQLALGGGLGVLAGSTGIERAATRLMGKAAVPGRQDTVATTMDLAKAAGVGALKEAPIEGLQGGQERVASNIALQNEGFDTPTFEGAIGQGVLEATASAPLGGGFGVAERLARNPGAPAPAAPGVPPAPPVQPESSNSAGPADLAPFVNPPSLTGGDAAAMLAGQMGGFERNTDPLRAVVKPSEAMGINPSAGPLSRVAAASVDSGVTDQTAMDEARAAAIQEEPAAPGKEAPADPDAPMLAAIESYNEDMQGMASPSMVSSRFGITVERAAALLAKIEANPTPQVNDLFPRPAAAPQDLAGAKQGLADAQQELPQTAAIDEPAANVQDPAPAPQPEAAAPETPAVEAPAPAGGNGAAAAGVPDAGRTDAAAPAVATPASADKRPAEPASAPQDRQAPTAITKAELDKLQVSEMSDAQLRAGDKAYGAVHKRAIKMRKEIARREEIQKQGLDKSPAPQPQEPSNETQQEADARPNVPDEARQEADEEGVLSDGAQTSQAVETTEEGRPEAAALLPDQVGADQAPAAPAPAPASESPVTAAANEAATSPANDLPEPTAAQKEAGNYKKGHLQFDGLDLTIENPVGSTRTGTDGDGKPWSVEMTAHYGYHKRTKGADGDQLDVYLAAEPKVGVPVFVVDQYNDDGSFDESKAIAGVATEAEATAIYDAHFSDGSGPRRRKAVTSMSVEQFKEWATSERALAPAANDKDSFVPAPDGGLDYGEITPAMSKAMRRQAGKIRLQRGNDKFGLTHIQMRHGDEIRAAGFPSVEAFVADIAQGIGEVWQPDATSQLVAIKKSGNDRVMFVQLTAEKDSTGDFYTVRTAFPSRADYVRNKKKWKMLWEGRAQPSQPATSGQAPFAVPPQDAGEAATIPSGQSGASVPDETALTQAEAAALMTWQEMGTEGGVKRHILTFYRSKADADEKRGRMTVASITKGDVSSAKWAIDGSADSTFAMLPAAKRAAEAKAMEQAIADGFVTADTTPELKSEPAAKPKKQNAVAQRAADAQAARADYFTPGNIVRRYGGTDEVLTYETTEGGGFNVTVHEVTKVGDQWHRVGKPQNARRHSTQPDARALAEGPIERLGYTPAAEVVYTSPRADGQPFASAVDRGVAPVADSDVSTKSPELNTSDEPVQESAKTEQVPEKSVIGDAGEKIGGARKDRWKDRGMDLSDLDAMSESEGAELAIKANVWKPDYEAIAETSEPVTAAMVKVVYDQLAARPKDNTPQGRRDYVTAMQAARKAYTEAQSVDEVKNAGKVMKTAIGVYDADAAQVRAARKVLFSVYKGRSDPFVFGFNELQRAKKLVTDGFPGKSEPWKSRLAVRAYDGVTNPSGITRLLEWAEEAGTPITEDQVKAGYAVVMTKVGSKRLAVLPTAADAEAAAKTIYERDMKGKSDGKDLPDRPNLDAIKRENLPARIDRDVTPDDFIKAFGFRGVEFGLWSAQDERQRIINMAYDGLMDLAEIMRVPPRAMSLNGTMGMAFGARGSGRALAHYEPGKLVINMTKIRGGGSLAHEWAHALDHYFGELGRPDAYTTKARGASGWYNEDQYKGIPRSRMVQAEGKWTKVEERRLENLRPDLAKAFDGVMLAIFQNQITKAEMVREQELAIERAQGFAATETDPAMKEVYQRQAQGMKEVLEDIKKDPDERLYDGRGRTAYANEAQRLSGKSENGYWVRPTEMFARAFESWVFDRVTAMGARSDYLVHGVEEDRFAGGGYKGNPYPTGAERARINGAFESLAETIQTKADDAGNVAMFLRVDATDPAGDTAANENATAQEAAANIRVLERAIARNSDGTRDAGEVRPYDARVLPNDEGLREIAAAFGSTLQGFGLRPGLLAAQVEQYGFFNGVRTGGIVFVAAKGNTRPHLAILGHELGHELRTRRPDLYDRLVEAIRPYVDQKKYAAEFLNSPVARNAGDKDKQREEFIGEVLSDGFMDRDFWRALGNKNPSLLRQIGGLLMNLVEKVLKNVGYTRKTEKYLTDYKAVMTIAGEVMAEFGVKRGALGVTAFNAKDGAQTDTPAFKRWFGDSKVVDARGQPMVVYHGTNQDFTRYDGIRTGERNIDLDVGDAFFFTDSPSVASDYAMAAIEDRYRIQGGENVQAVYLAMKNPLVWDFIKDETDQLPGDIDIDADSLSDEVLIVSELVRHAKENGYDGLITLNHDDGGPKRMNQWIAFRPEQIKSAIGNRGTFDPNESDTRFNVKDTAARSIAGVMNNVREASLPAGYIVNDFMQSNGKVSWWHKSVGTMYDLAQREPLFRPVFEAAQKFLSDVSFYATQAADMAPTILPKLETLKDITKSPLAAKDAKAIATPIFEGTLVWGRDPVTRKPIKMEELEARAAKMSTDEKAQEMLRQRALDPAVMRMWQGLPEDQYNANINTRYTNQMLKSGTVFTSAELQSLFGLDERQAGLYAEFRAATDKSITDMAVADMVRFGGKDLAPVADVVLEAKTLEAAAQVARDYLVSMAEADPDRNKVLTDSAARILDKAASARDLMDRGYAPLSRFGKYSVDVVSPDGERLYFGLFESQSEANKMVRKMRDNYPDATIATGTMSAEAYKVFAGVTPETLELFGEMLGLEATGDDAKDKAFQEYLKLAKNQRSAMKRLIHRKGIAGFSEDPGRVLAGFIYSNSRQISTSLNLGNLKASLQEIPKGEGELADVAAKLTDYVSNPIEEAQAIRGLLFAQYLGGSVASAMLNALQPVQVTIPWLSQYGGPMRAASRMNRAIKDVLTKAKLEDGLAAAIKKAEEQGIVSPQEVFQLQAQAAGRASLSGGDGTRLGDAAAAANNALSRVSLAWGKLFGAAEQFNRRTTFIAAYRTAQEQRINDPAKFAERAVNETQFIYNKGNKPQWARGAIGSTVFTFKQYSISYVELMQRMYSRGGPEGKKAALLGIGVLLLMSGVGGLPFIEDIDDVVDGFMQRVMNRNFSSKQAREQFFIDLLGEGGSDFVTRGLSGLPGAPVDVSGRLGLGNLLPGTGIFQKKDDYGRDLLEIVGPAGDFGKRILEAAGKTAQGEVFGQRGALMTLSPVAARNLAIAYDMATTGSYQDTRGRKVIDTTETEAAFKAIGFQPATVDRVQDATFREQRMISLNKIREGEIADKWARGVYQQDPELVQDARAEMAAWNENNPESPIRINLRQISQRVNNMKMDKTERIAKTAPKELRAALRERLEQAR